MRTIRYLRSFLGADAALTAAPFLLLGSLVIIEGVQRASALRWLSDDIFITFRYIDQWFAGHGLVYNPGEYVEGYTHPLWLLLLSGWRWLGFDMVSGSTLFGIVSQGLLLATMVYASWRMAGRASNALPVAAAAVALHYDAAVWATSGLETALFTFLVAAAVVVFSVPDIGERARLLTTGALLVLATLTRPDGILFLITMGLIVIAREWSRGSGGAEVRTRLLQFALPSLIFIPYAVWKVFYYGDLLPNTYYAKSGGGAHIAQGLTYAWMFVKGYPSTMAVLAAFLALPIAFSGKRPFRAALASIFADRSLSLSVVCLLLSVVYTLLFVVRVGGDFMYARFMVPVVPLLYLSAEAAMRALIRERRRLLWPALLIIPLLVGTVDGWNREKLFSRSELGEMVLGDGSSGIIDEHAYWTRPLARDGTDAIGMLRAVGEKLHGYFNGLTVRILIKGQASLAYASQATDVIENWGLTDPFIARLPISERGRIGHEKAAPYGYLIQRRVHFSFIMGEPPADMAAFRLVRFALPYDGWYAEMYTYDSALMNTLKERFPGQVDFVDFQKYLDDYLASSDERKWEEMERDFAEFRDFYFMHNADAEREAKMLDAMKKKQDAGTMQ